MVDAQDLFLKYNFKIIAEFNVSINHCLLVNKGTELKYLSKVYSHPQALSQCSNFLSSLNIVPMSNIDTAFSAKCLSEKPDRYSGVIASEIAASEYGLEILKNNIQNEQDNTTRFLLVKKMV